MNATQVSSDNDLTSTPYGQLGDEHIRLLTLIRHDGLHLWCRLDTYAPEQVPEYDAVSYCWGESTTTTTVKCNEKDLAIRTSLFVALKHFLEGTPCPLRPLWVDAISLNQDDEHEKAHQVPRMGQIYRMATRTLIWLGKAADNSDKAMEFFRDFNQQMEGKNVPKACEALGALETSEDGKVVLDALRALMRRPWFSRLWIVQEVVLSEFCLAICGQEVVDWSTLVDFSMIIRRHNLVRLFVDLSQGFELGVVGLPVLMIEFLEELRLSVREVGCVATLAGMLMISETKQCGEPVDRIWAISGLLNLDLQQLIKESAIIDYTATGRSEYWTSYVEFMKLLLSYNPDDFWNVLLGCHGLTKHHCLPSWCPDFNATRHYEKLWLGEGSIAGGKDPAPGMLMLPGTRLLSVKGSALDTVQNVTRLIGPKSWKLSEEISSEIREWFQQIFSLVYEVIPESRHAAEKLHEVLHTERSEKVAGHEKQKTRNLGVQTLSVAYADWSRGSAASMDVPKLNDYGLLASVPGRKFFNTSQGRIGIGPADMGSGDLLCIIERPIQVYVLRPADRESLHSNGVHPKEDLEGQRELFSLIGNAYVQGCMNGEAFTAPGCDLDRDFVLA